MRLAAALTVFAAIGLSSCGGNDSTPTGSTQMPTGPSRASITVTASNPILSFGTTRNFRLTFSLRTQETAGLGANMNFIRIEPRVLGVAVERQEIGASIIKQQTGTNRVEANGTRNDNVFIEFNNGNATDIVLTVGFTDDRGNDLQSTFTITF